MELMTPLALHQQMMGLCRIHATSRIALPRGEESGEGKPVDSCGLENDECLSCCGTGLHQPLVQDGETVWSLFNGEWFAWLLLESLPAESGCRRGTIDTDKQLVYSIRGSIMHVFFLSGYCSFSYGGVPAGSYLCS